MHTGGQPPYQAASPRYYTLRGSAGFSPEEMEQQLGAEYGSGAEQAPSCAVTPMAQLLKAAFGDLDITPLSGLCSENIGSYAVLRAQDSPSFFRTCFSTGSSSPSDLNPLLVVFPPKGSAERGMSSHSGQEFIQVLDGRLEVSLHDKTEILNPGDSIFFNSLIPHALNGLDDVNAVSVVVVVV